MDTGIKIHFTKSKSKGIRIKAKLIIRRNKWDKSAMIMFYKSK